MRPLSLLLFFLTACTDKADEPDAEPSDIGVDDDGDGQTVEDGDCDDSDATVYTDAVEVCDELDNDCDGEVDEGVSTTFYADTDADGHGDDDTVVTACIAPEGHIPVGGDCDDTDGGIHPYAEEVCDDIDNDCDSLIDADDDSLSADSQGVFYTDTDGDGYGDDATGIAACEAPEGTVAEGGDCDDSSTDFHPGAEEEDCTDPADYNCDGSVGYADNDGDGFPACEECDDTDAAISPDAAEVCDSIDNDCDSLTDDEDEIDAASLSTFYADTDGDGYGDPDATTAACEAPSGYLTDDADCDDGDAAISPDADEICDELDNDCDSRVDIDAIDASTWYVDNDTDGFGDASTSLTSCDQPFGTVADNTDCDDAARGVNPDADEICDEQDNDCDGNIDVDATDATTWYADADGDGYGDVTDTQAQCDQPSGYVADDDDCDDGDSGVNPDAEEVCDDVDNDCDGTTDDGATDATTWYADDDGDGYGNPEADTTECDQPSDYVSDDEDCDDTDAAINPDGTELCDGIDNDCDGADDDAGLAAFEADDGTWTDLTTTLAAGTSSSPTTWDLADDGTLWLCEGTWYAAITVTATTATITGRSGVDDTTLSGADAEVPITAGAVNLTVSDLTVTEGSSIDCGGAIDAADTTLTLSKVNLTESIAASGGGLCLDGGSASLSDVTLSNNATTVHGGGLYCTDATLAISSGVFLENDAGEEGGGLYLDTCVMSASSLTAADNISGDEGGGLAMRSSSTLALTGSTFSDNTAGKNGGGLYIKDSTLTASSTTLQGNDSAKKGGGLYIDEEDSSISSMTITENTAEEGAGLMVNDCILTIEDSTITDNTASKDDGGGMTIEKDGSAEVIDTDWSGNSPDDVYLKHVMDTYSYGASESFSCDDSECQ
ncbi:MAG: putative outer membrane repeat protein [Myxococcota bacterium]|jgi:predicted outer membrane repeat protein